MRRAAVLAAALALAAGPAAAQDWRALDPENTLVIDTSKGRMIVEMRPDLAPKAVARIKLLAREKVYDGLQFHRVVAGFVAQTGNPNNKDGGVSKYPDLEPEFTFRLPLAPRSEKCTEQLLDQHECDLGHFRLLRTIAVASHRDDGNDGLAGSVPVLGELSGGEYFRGWGAYCTGVAGMGRQADPGSANSEIFFMLAPERRLDHDYTVWGRIVLGGEVLQSLAVGEPPANPDVMRQVRVAADLPPAQRPRVEVEGGEALTRRIATLRTEKGADFSVCDVPIVARVNGKG